TPRRGPMLAETGGVAAGPLRTERAPAAPPPRPQTRPGTIVPRGPPALPAIQQAIKDLQSQMAHSNLVSIRKAECYPASDLIRIFLDLIPFPSDVPSRLLHRG